MRAFPADACDIDYSFQPPVLVVADTESAREKAVVAISASGGRIAAITDPREAVSRLSRQAAASVLWMEFETDAGEQMDALLTGAANDVEDGRYAAVVSTTDALIDPVTARVGETDVQIIINAGEADRCSALALALSGMHRDCRLSDVASDRSAERLRVLSEEVNRIASTLARLSNGPAYSRQTPAVHEAFRGAPEISIDVVRSVVRSRRLRSRYFPTELFADPAWDMLLDLFHAELAQLRVSVSSLCIAAAVPSTTALRWLKTMTSSGLCSRRADPHDRRRIYVELSPETSLAMRHYFAEVGRPQVV